MSVERLKGPDVAARMARDIAEAWERGAAATARGERVTRLDHCGGAVLRLSRLEAMALPRGGIALDGDPAGLPDQGTHQVRVRCSKQVNSKVKAGTIVTYALCAACEGLEKGNRIWLSQQAKKAAEAERPSFRRRGYAESAR